MIAPLIHLPRPKNDRNKALELQSYRCKVAKVKNVTPTYSKLNDVSQATNDQPSLESRTYFWSNRFETPLNVRGHRNKTKLNTTFDSVHKPWSRSDKYETHLDQTIRPESQRDVQRVNSAWLQQKKTIKPRSQTIDYGQQKVYFNPIVQQAVTINQIASSDVNITSDADKLHDWVDFDKEIRILRNINFYKQVPTEKKQKTKKSTSPPEQKQIRIEINDSKQDEDEKIEDPKENSSKLSSKGFRQSSLWKERHDFSRLPFNKQVALQRLKIRQNIESYQSEILRYNQSIQQQSAEFQSIYFGFQTSDEQNTKVNITQEPSPQ